MLFISTLRAAGTDSLKLEYAKLKDSDTARVSLLLAICDKYFYDNPDTLEHYARKAVTLSQQHNRQRAEGKAFAYLGEAFFLHGKPDSAMAFYNKGLNISHKIKAKDLTAFILNNIGSIYLRQNDYKTAINYYDSVIALSAEVGEKDLMAAAYSNKASIFFTQGSYAIALKQYLQGLKLYEELNNKRSIETATLNIANVYNRLNEYEKAKQYVSRAMDMARVSGSKWSVISCNTTLALIFNQQKQYDSALVCLNEALQLAQSLNNIYLTNLLKGNLAEAYMKKGNLPLAKDLYTETLPVSEQLGDVEGIAIAKAGIGEVLARQGKLAEGIPHLTAALKMMQEADVKEQARNIAEILSTTYEKAGNYAEALRYTRIKEAYRDSLLKDESHRAALSAGFEYELGKKETEIALLEKDKAIEENKITRNRVMLFSALAAALLAIIIAIMVFRNMLSIKKRNTIIMQQKHEIELQAAKLKKLNDFKDTTFSVLSHDLRSPINALTGTMSMLDDGIITPAEFSMYKNELNNKLQSVTLMLDNLLQWAKSQMKGEHTLDIEKISVRRKVLRTFAVLKDAAEQKNISLTTDVPEDQYVSADRNQVEMVLRNLVSNAIKFTPVHGTITISSEVQGNNIAISITDSGVGMTKEQAAQLFDGSPNASTHGTSGEKGTGIGLHLSHNFIINNHGSITVQSSEGNGTTFTVMLPSA